MLNTEAAETYGLLKGEYIRLLNEKDVLLNWGRTQLEAIYTASIGQYQVQLLEVQLRDKALKRKMELAYAAINTDQTPDFDAINNRVSVELEEVCHCLDAGRKGSGRPAFTV